MFYTSNLSFIKNPNNPHEYILNQKWVNYKYEKEGYKEKIKNLISLNSFFTVDKNFKVTSNNYFFNKNNIIFNETLASFGYEDIRLINIDNKVMCYYSSFVKFNDSYKTLLGLNKYFYNNVSISKLDIINKECCDLLLSDLKKEVTKRY